MYHECHAAAGPSLLHTNHGNCLDFMHTRLTVNGFLERSVKGRRPVINKLTYFSCYKKNVDPYAESTIVNGASKYTYACSAVKYNPNGTVKNNP
jgi:hypothetical protein